MLVIQLKKTDYNTKISKTEKKITDRDHDKHITTPEFDNLTGENVSKDQRKHIQQAKMILLIS